MQELREGLKYLQETPSIGFVILMLACVSLLVLPFTALLPVYARNVFKGGASVFGYLNSAIGMGAVGGAIFLASVKAGANLKKILFVNLVIFGIALICFSHLTNLPVALFFAMMAGFGMMSQTTNSNTIIQTSASPAMRGRVISYFAMAFFGMQPLGGLLIGAISQRIGVQDTIVGSGIAALVIAIVFLPFLRKEILKKKDKIELVELEDPSVTATPSS